MYSEKERYFLPCWSRFFVVFLLVMISVRSHLLFNVVFEYVWLYLIVLFYRFVSFIWVSLSRSLLLVGILFKSDVFVLYLWLFVSNFGHVRGLILLHPFSLFHS